ncbi:MAG: hypothetical protein Q8P76_02445 [bacterium]|nr:hypothetical protein [bacterium]
MWEEREIVSYLRDYHSSPELGHQTKIDAIKEGVERGNFFAYVGKKKYGLDIRKILETNREEWKKIRYLVDECLEDGYLIERVTETNGALTSSDEDGVKIVTGQYLYLTSKGKKLLRKSYFYFKYLPEEFGDLKIVLLTIIGTIITSPIWQPFLNFIKDRLSF